MVHLYSNIFCAQFHNCQLYHYIYITLVLAIQAFWSLWF